MKLIFALLILVLSAGCYKNTGDGKSPNGGGNPQKPTGETGFTAHAWCYAFFDSSGRAVQARYMFASAGGLSYQKYTLVNGERDQFIGRADGSWTLLGQVLQITLNNKTQTYQMAYNYPDAATGTERVHIYVNGQDQAYDPCL